MENLSELELEKMNQLKSDSANELKDDNNTTLETNQLTEGTEKKKKSDFDPNNSPISVLVDTLKKDNIANRVKAIENLTTFCTALGPNRTRVELIPFIKGKSQPRKKFEKSAKK